MIRRVAVLHASIPYQMDYSKMVCKSFVEELQKANIEAELISIPFNNKTKNDLYSSILMWGLLNLRNVTTEKVDLVVSTNFPTHVIEHDNKKIWFMNQSGVEDSLSLIFADDEIRDKITGIEKDNITNANLIGSDSKKSKEKLQELNINSNIVYHPGILGNEARSDSYGDYILYVGNDNSEGFKVFLEALRSTKSKAVILSNQKHRVMDQAVKLGIDSQIELKNMDDHTEIINSYANARAVFVDTRDYSPVIDAFASERPVVTYDNNDEVCEFVNDKKNGIICKQRVDDVSDAFEKLFSDDGMCEKFGRTGKKDIADITWENAIKQLIDEK